MQNVRKRVFSGSGLALTICSLAVLIAGCNRSAPQMTTADRMKIIEERQKADLDFSKRNPAQKQTSNVNSAETVTKTTSNETTPTADPTQSANK